jgi:RNA polymerase sigma-70 factor, ECF subfamily
MDPTSVGDNIRKAQNGDRIALEQLLLMHLDSLETHVRNHLDRSLQSARDSEDLIQQVLIRAFVKFSSFTGSDQPTFFAWLRAIADHLMTDVARHEHRAKRGGGRNRVVWSDENSIQALCEFLQATDLTESRKLSNQEAEQAIRLGIAELPEDYRQAIFLFYFEDQTIAQIAAKMSRTDGAVRGILDRARDRLRDTLERASRWLG